METKETKVTKNIGIVIGRFQPFHKGHRALINHAIEECDQVVVFIGSSNKLRDFNNPFSNEERKEFILRSYVNEEKLNIMYLHDKPSLSDWVSNVYGFLDHLADVDLDPSTVNLYTSDKDAEFYGETFLFNIVPCKVPGVSGTSIRKGLYDGNGERSLMPQSTASMVDLIVKTKHWEHMRAEFTQCLSGKARATMAHQFNNPVEPVVHAVVTQSNKVLLVKRNTIRGYGQWAIPGGFLESNESTQAGALRELREETGVDLKDYQCAQLAMALEENLDDLSVRTLGINFLFAVKPEEVINVVIDPEEILEYKWTDIADITSEREILFYNHNLVVQRLLSVMAATAGDQGEQGDHEENQ